MGTLFCAPEGSWEEPMRKKFALMGTGAMLIFALGSSSSATNVARPMGRQSFAVSAQARQQQQPTQEFQGTIEKAGAKYILDDKASGATYQLDNQDKAKQFADKDVKVTGTLDPSTNTIEVSEIEETK
jgi:hypothetical protein